MIDMHKPQDNHRTKIAASPLNSTNKIMDLEQETVDAAEAERSRRRSLRNTRERARRQQEDYDHAQARRQTRNTRNRLRRHQESPEQVEQRRQARREADRQRLQ